MSFMNFAPIAKGTDEPPRPIGNGGAEREIPIDLNYTVKLNEQRRSFVI
jgi:hypothetical protein